MLKNEYDWKIDPDCRQDRSSGKCVTRKMTSEEIAKYGLAKKEDIDMSVKLDVDEAIQKEEEKKEARASTIDIVKEVTEMMEMLPDEIINHPKHYTFGKVEVIDYIEDKLTSEEFEGYCIGNTLKYLSRYRHKGGTDDLKKARWYLDRIIKVKECG